MQTFFVQHMISISLVVLCVARQGRNSTGRDSSTATSGACQNDTGTSTAAQNTTATDDSGAAQDTTATDDSATTGDFAAADDTTAGRARCRRCRRDARRRGNGAWRVVADDTLNSGGIERHGVEKGCIDVGTAEIARRIIVGSSSIEKPDQSHDQIVVDD